jgi:hypothetical protein
MPSEITQEMTAALIAAGVAALTGLLLRLRARRIAKWVLILEEPASSVALLSARPKRAPKWLREIPQDLNLRTEAPLFEALYLHHRNHPSQLGSPVLKLALLSQGAAPDRELLSAPQQEQARFSDEDKIKTLMGAKPDPAGLVPTEALAENVVLNLVNVLKGKKKLTVGLEHALLDSLGAAGGLAGSKVGGALGIASAAVLTGLSVPLVPVLVLLGALIGSLVGKRAGGWLKGWRGFSAVRKMQLASRNFKKWFLDQFPEFLAVREQEFREAIARTRELQRRHQNRFSRFWLPDLTTVFLRLSLVRLEHDCLAEKQRLERLRGSIRALDPLEFSAVLTNLDEASARSHPQLFEHYQAYQAALAALRDARTAAEPSIRKKSA